MSAHATQAIPPNDPGPPAADAPYYRGVLHAMIDRGADLTRVLHELALAHAAQQATSLAQQAPPTRQTAPASPAPDGQQASTHAPQAADAQPAPVPPPAPAPDALIRIAASFDQVTRGVRRSIMLAQHLDAPKQQQPARPPAQQAPDRTTARKRIIRAVEDVIQRPPDNDECDDAEVLLSDFRERMDAPDLDDDIANRPAEDIIKEILRDLGLAALPGSRPWKRRTQADITSLNASAAAPSGPARSANRQPGPDAGPQDGHPAATQHSSDPAPPCDPGQPEPGHSAAPARPPTRPGDVLPKDPAEAVAFVLRQAARTNVRWRPPPGD